MATLILELHELWHAGTGLGDGPGADALVYRSTEGFPMLPGRSVKGLLREACMVLEEVGALAAGRVDVLFGDSGDPEASPGDRRFTTSPGCLRVSDATPWAGPGERAEWAGWARGNRAALAQLTTTLASTALDESGRTRNKTLRTVEYAVPMTLYARLSSQDPEALADVGRALPLLRALGTRRHRGFGRCTARLEEVGHG